MRLPVILALPVIVAACATPREQCLAQVSQQLVINERLITETRANIQRGFGLRQEQRVREVRRICRGETESGEEVLTRCEQVQVRNVNVPVALDLNAEEAKLASLTERNRQLRSTLPAAQEQCRARFPE